MTTPAPPPPDDADLIRRFQRDPAGADGRRAAEQLFRRHQGAALRWCRRFTSDPDEALDLCQEALMTAARDLVQFEGRAAFTSWLFVVTRRACLRSRRRKRFAVDDGVDADALPGREPSIEDAFLARESETRVLRALDHALDERERTALWLRCVEGRSVEDITDLLGLDAASGARGLLQTARRRLRSALERGGLPREDRP